MLAPGAYLMIQYFYTLQNDHLDKPSYHLSLYKVITILLTVFSMLQHVHMCEVSESHSLIE